MAVLILVITIVVLLMVLIFGVFSRYRKCPSDKIMVIYGKVGSNQDGTRASAKCMHGGAAFIMPVLQYYLAKEVKNDTAKPVAPSINQAQDENISDSSVDVSPSEIVAE